MSTCTSTLDTLRQSAEADYKRLVFAVAGGGPVDPAALQAVLWPLGKSVDDFAAHVETAKHRLAGEWLEETADPQFAEQISALESRRVELGEVVRRGKEAAKSIDFDKAKIERLLDMAKPSVNTFPMASPGELEKEAASIEASLSGPKERVAAGEVAAAEIVTIDAEIARLHDEQKRPECMAW